jgi:hypothetical protein
MEKPEAREAIEKNLIYVSSFALRDPPRDHIYDSVQKIRYGRVFEQTSESVEPY